MKDASLPLPGAYQQTHGKQVAGPFLPYVEEYARVNQIELARIGRELFPNGFSKPGEDMLISSYRRTTSDWTYVSSGSALIYELLKVRTAGGESLVLVLYNPAVPANVLDEHNRSTWHVALFDAHGRRIADCEFVTQIPHKETGMWDTITTDLLVEDGSPVAKIDYAHAGGGGPRDQEFAAWFEITKPLGLRLLRSRQTGDSYP